MTEAFCSECGTPVDTGAHSGNYQAVEGWMKLRPRGANEIALKRPRPKFMCSDCMDAIRSGVAPTQETLL